MTVDDYEQLFERHYAPLVRSLSLAADDAEAAADAVQDAFVQLHRHWRRVSAYDQPEAWLRRVALHRVFDNRRGLRRRAAAVARLAHERPPTLPDEESELLAAVRGLPVQQRTAVALHYLADLSVAKVAMAMDLAEGTVKSHLFDARARLRARLEVQP